jgi:hypothetical protein
MLVGDPAPQESTTMLTDRVLQPVGEGALVGPRTLGSCSAILTALGQITFISTERALRAARILLKESRSRFTISATLPATTASTFTRIILARAIVRLPSVSSTIP